MKDAKSKSSNFEAFLNNLLKEINIVSETITQEEYDTLKGDIEFALKTSEKGIGGFLKVPYKSALSLVGRRLCFLKAGYVYIHKESYLEQLIAEYFKADLAKLLNFSVKHLPSIVKDLRMKEILMNISKKDLIDFEYNPAAKKISSKLSV